MDYATILSLLDATIRLSTPLLLACLAGMYSERAGLFDIGLEGKMLAAAFAAATVAALTGSAWLGLAAGLATSLITGSRGGWVALPIVAALAFWELRRGKSARWKVLTPVIAVLLFASVYASSNTVRDRIDVVSSNLTQYEHGHEDTSVGVRLQLYRTALYLIGELGFSALQYGFVDGFYQGVTALVRVVGGLTADLTRRPKLIAALGYALSGSWTLIVFWFPCLIAWLCKVLILRYGGMRLYVWARPFFLGMVLGEFTMAVLWTLPFAAAQLQYALHPQLEGGSQARIVSAGYAEQAVRDEMYAGVGMKQPPPKIIQQVVPPPVPSAPPAPVEEVSSNVAAPSLPTIDAASVRSRNDLTAESRASYPVARGSKSKMSDQIDSRSVIQAGAGMPSWNQGNDYRLGWSGPVTAEQSTRLVIAPAWLVRLLRVVMVGLLALLLAKLVPLLLTPLRGRWRDWRGGGAVSAALLAIALLPAGVHAQNLPSQDLLNQLRDRLTEAPKCAPACAAVAQAQLLASGDTLDVELEAHMGATVALPLPQVDDALQLLGVGVDGHANAPLSRRGDQLLLRLERGVHRVSLRYRIGATDNASLRFVLRPQRIVFSGQDWSLAGVDDGRPLGDSIALQRMRTATDGKDLPPVQNFPPYVRLTRRLQLGVDWTVESTVERIAPQDGGFSVTLPLLPGEHPLGDDVLVKDGRISITFNANSDEVSWSSRLDHATKLSLQAPALGERAEVWAVHAAPMWHVDAKGVPTSASDDGLLYQPLPGESLQLAFSKPVAIDGDSLAFDGVQVTSRAGERATETTLSLRARSTRGGEHAISLPAGAELLDANRDGEPINLAVRDGKLSLPLLPGEHGYTLRLREPHGVAVRTRTPVFALHAPVANVDLALQLPQDRWVLWTWGPTTGPAVLYWSQLLVLLFAAWLLARYAPTPLRFRHWLLLGLGFSAFAWSAYALVVVWLILLGLRARSTPSERLGSTKFNLMQLGLALLTLLALVVLIGAVPKGLLGLPDMHVAGNASNAWNLRWFADQSAGALPGAGVLSVSLWVYKLAMLAWALWLAWSLIDWLRWAFDAWTRGGYWRKPAPKPGAAPPQLPPSATEPPHA